MSRFNPWKPPGGGGGTTIIQNPFDDSVLRKKIDDLGINVKKYGASGSATTTTGSINSGSKVLTVASVSSFEVGQDIAISNAAAVSGINYIEVTKAPTTAGNLDFIIGGNTYSLPLNPLPQIFEVTFSGTSPSERQFGIVLDGVTHYITVYQGETAVAFANRLRTDGYFTDMWSTWTIGGVADTNVVSFTSRYAGARQWNSQVFDYTGFSGVMTTKQVGTGDINYVINQIADVLKITGYRQKVVAPSKVIRLTREAVGLAPAVTYNANGTGVELNIQEQVNGVGEIIGTIVSIDSANKRITIDKNAYYTVTNVEIRHDDTRAIQKALDDMWALGGGKVVVPDGTYRHTGLYMKDKVSFIGNSMSRTILVNHSKLWSSLYVQGIGGDVANEAGFLDKWEIRDFTLTTNAPYGVLSKTQIGVDLLFCHSVTIRNLQVIRHGIGVYEKCVWYTQFENIYINRCVDGWYYPEFHPSNSPSSRFNIVIADNSGYGMFIENSPDVFAWFGGAVERNTKGGIIIYGGATRSLVFEGINIEENGGYQVEVGTVEGIAPSNISFRNCSFKNWQPTKPECAIKLNRVIGFELQNAKFFNFDIGLKAENPGSTFFITLSSFDGCRKNYQFKDLEVGDGYNTIIGSWAGVVGITSTGFQQIGSVASKSNEVSISALAELIANGVGSAALTPQSRGYVHAAIDYGTIGDGSDGDDTKLQNALNKATELRLPLFIPAGSYKLTFGLVADSSKYTGGGDTNVMIYGAGGTSTKLLPTSYAFDAITIQNGSSGAGSGVAPSGFIRDIYIEGTTNNATTNNAKGLLLRGMRQFEVKNVTVKRMPIGFDMIDNCYGTVYYNCRTERVSVGINLRAGAVSGSDMNFYNCWFAGNIAAVHISPDGGGWHFFGGQLGGGNARTVDDDNAGAIIIGKDYITGATGTSANIIFDGIDFEGIRYMHTIRSFGQVSMTIRNSSFLQTDSSQNGLLAATLSVWKATGAQQSKVIFENNGIKGYWKNAKAINVEGHGSLIEIHERGTLYESNVKFNNVAWTSQPLLVQSKCNLGHAHWRDSWVSKFLVGGTIYREASGRLERSTDWGATYVPVDTQVVAVPATATSPGKVGDYASDANYFYSCYATNTWSRVPIATW
jgi:hypothetical protein